MITVGGLSLAGLYVRSWLACWALTYIWFVRSPRSFAMFVMWYTAAAERSRRG